MYPREDNDIMTCASISDTIAISVRDFLKYGCPNCGYLPQICLEANWALISEYGNGKFGDIGTCPCCQNLLIIVEQEATDRPINIGLELREGYSAFTPQLTSHPRTGTPYHQNFVGPIQVHDLPGTLYADLAVQTNAA